MLTSTTLESPYHCRHIIYKIFKNDPGTYAVVCDVDQAASCDASEREHHLPAPGRSKAVK